MLMASQASATSLWPPIDLEPEMNKKVKTPNKAKPQRSTPALNQTAWPAQSPNAGIKRASSMHDRKPTGRGAARGR